MILPLVQDMVNMSAESLRTRFPHKYEYIKTIAKEIYPHIEIEEKAFKQNINAQRLIIGQNNIYWLIMINDKLTEKQKYITLIHELMHCYIDEVKALTKDEEEVIIKTVENNLFLNFNKKSKNDNI